MGNLFSVAGIGVIAHTPETKKILEPHAKNRRQSKFVRNCILEYAKNKGWELEKKVIGKPAYINEKSWEKLTVLREKSYYINYDFVLAFYWLLEKQAHTNKGKLVRQILTLSNSA